MKSCLSLALKRLDKVVLVVGTTPTAWGRFGSGLVYQAREPY